MAKDDTRDPAAAARAGRLHDEINKIVKPKSDGGKDEPSSHEEPAKPSVNYREAIRRRMHELDDKA
jgi:hypothetical protein